MELLVAFLGLTDYSEGLALQEKLLKLRQEKKVGDVLLLLEHPPIFTLGRNAKKNNIIMPTDFLHAQGIQVYESSRGGDVTYHGPGQIVGYPILDLNLHGRDIPLYIRKMEEVFISLLGKHYGITAGRAAKYPGVWVEEEKITAIGCAVKRWVTMHGFALNVNTNLSHFQFINPCGITDKGVTSLAKLLGQPQDLELVYQQVLASFCEIFGFSPQVVAREDLGDGGTELC